MLDWQTSPRWTGDHKSLLLSPDNDTAPILDLTLSEIMAKSSRLPVAFPISSIQCSQLKKRTSEKTLQENINSAYPVIHEYALYLSSIFLLHQRKFGPKSEFYENTSLTQLIDRLLSKRAITFLSPPDYYTLLSGEKGGGNWESIGTLSETPPLILENCLSYDEIKLSALLSVSSHSYFINDGDRYNNGVFEENREKIEENGVVIGLIGTRLEKPEVMEYREIIVAKEQNNSRLGYGRSEAPTLQNEFLNFYGGPKGTYEELLEQMKTSQSRYVDLGGGTFFDKVMYERRISLSIDTLLLEANDRAKKANKKAYVHVVGLGLGVWKLYSEQNKIFADTFVQRLEFLSKVLTNVSDVRLAYILLPAEAEYRHGDNINGIKLHVANTNPQTKLIGEDEGKLLVVSYPWDGNALPGNEFWRGSLCGSGDPAAACSTQVAELHTSHINGKVCGANLRVATLEGVVTFQEYQRMHEDDRI